ncbi:hypothetical protein EV648_105420 [Kribbella sp. VKM Ac-2568]|nr:hypothetical protein EV648_105420 [Kribbella sp. VKM Ac-2568]
MRILTSNSHMPPFVAPCVIFTSADHLMEGSDIGFGQGATGSNAVAKALCKNPRTIQSEHCHHVWITDDRVGEEMAVIVFGYIIGSIRSQNFPSSPKVWPNALDCIAFVNFSRPLNLTELVEIELG